MPTFTKIVCAAAMFATIQGAPVRDASKDFDSRVAQLEAKVKALGEETKHIDLVVCSVDCKNWQQYYCSMGMQCDPCCPSDASPPPGPA